jgi:hypothetical protein
MDEPTRRFVAPLVGIDPATVRIRRDPVAQATAAAHDADAITSGDVIALGAGHPEGEPETTALIAHELVHVARRRDARFVPPILRQAPPERALPGSAPVPGASPAAEEVDNAPLGTSFTAARIGAPGPIPDVSTVAPEEQLAREVERAVLPLARARRVAPGRQMESVAAPPVAQEPTPPRETQRPRADDRWGGLPAPWEPMPAWLVSPPPAGPPPGRLGGGGSTPPPGNGVMRAESGRPAAEAAVAAQPAAPAAPGTQQTPAPPDLDALAQQVFAIVKQRLAAERQRIGIG